MLNMCQISSFMAPAEGPVAKFWSFANFEEKKRDLNLFMSFTKIVIQIDSFGQIRKNYIFGFTLLKYNKYNAQRLHNWHFKFIFTLQNMVCFNKLFQLENYPKKNFQAGYFWFLRFKKSTMKLKGSVEKGR